MLPRWSREGDRTEVSVTLLCLRIVLVYRDSKLKLNSLLDLTGSHAAVSAI